MSQPLNAGVLIIGSLLWDERREAWRQSRLDMNSLETVTAPIRYGRRSLQRGGTYTMVFSRGAAAGQAKVIPFARRVATGNDLTCEAEQLWAAERNGTPNGEVSAGWGCVALLRNPERNIPQDLLVEWTNRVSRERRYGNVPQAEEEDTLVSADGLLRIDWPRRISDGASLTLDLLLVTATHPTLTGTPRRYPGVGTIAAAWNSDMDGHVGYFWSNVHNGIRTFQDEEIKANLLPRSSH